MLGVNLSRPKYRIKLWILISKPISQSQHGNKERNIENHLKSIPRVYIKLKNKTNNFGEKLFRSAKTFTGPAEFQSL